MSSLNKAVDLYRSGHSLPEVAEMVGKATSTVRYHVKKAGLLRSRADGVRKAAQKGKIGRPGPRAPWSKEVKERQSEAAKRRWAGKAKGVTIKPSGYVEHTTGEHKGRAVHVVLMEARLGRRILPDEVVHHIDGDRANNNINNLALMTRAAHTRLHQRERKLAKGI